MIRAAIITAALAFAWDRVVATCSINGRSVADLMRRAGVVEGGNGR